MNRRKKMKDILTKRIKQANLKANPKKAKPKYISKAERAQMELDAANQPSQESDATSPATNGDTPTETNT